MRLVVAALIVLSGCRPVERQDDLRPLVAAAGYYSLMAVPAPAPAGPTKCSNCNGLGYLTDGTVRTLCPVCKGSKATRCETGTCRIIGR